MSYKFLSHTADIKISVEEKNLEKAFESAAFALRETVLGHEKIKIAPKISRIISADGKDIGDLLYSWLEEFIFLLDAENFILSDIEDIEIAELEKEKGKKEFVLTAKVLGDKASNYKFTNTVKAITFNDMKVHEDKDKKGKLKKVSLQFVLDV